MNDSVENHAVPDQPLVSIITVVLNGKDQIEKTINSVLQQSYPALEYIIIDGGSSDGTVDIIQAHNDKISYWKSEADTGISDAFNKGIKAAHGHIIGIINAGDWYEKDAVQQVVDCFLADKSLGIACGALQFWNGPEKDYLCYPEPGLLEKDMSVIHPSCFVRADLYKDYGLFSLQYQLAMDYELLLRFKTNLARFLASDTVWANMAQGGVSDINWKAALLETHKARQELLKNSFFRSKSYYYFLFCKRSARIFLQKIGLDSLIKFPDYP
ncbi:MAG: glycosyltransferase [gamma proteobacterium symbiont of Bathyaustriella thionipta]|nr:glycosyltransferase [gamma proteobacterium symbiont of Bathyaustriella thionipta]